MLGVIVVVHWAACVPEGDHRPILSSRTRDSAGITIVENGRPFPGSRLPWRVADAPAVSIGTHEGEEGEMLFIVLDATRLADGRIVVANAGTSELRVFGADGDFLETWIIRREHEFWSPTRADLDAELAERYADDLAA